MALDFTTLWRKTFIYLFINFEFVAAEPGIWFYNILFEHEKITIITEVDANSENRISKNIDMKACIETKLF